MGYSPGEEHVTGAEVLLEILASSDGPLPRGGVGELELTSGTDLVPEGLGDVGDMRSASDGGRVQ